MDVKTVVSLSEREEAFVLNLARGMRPTRAATAAGWSVASARALLNKPHLIAAIRSITANMLAACHRIDKAA